MYILIASNEEYFINSVESIVDVGTMVSPLSVQQVCCNNGSIANLALELRTPFKAFPQIFLAHCHRNMPFS